MSTRSRSIRSILRAHLLDMDGLPPVNWEGHEFTVPKNADGGPDIYLRETLMRNVEKMGANGELMAFGILQIDVFNPAHDLLDPAETLADDIKRHFAPGQTLSGMALEGSEVKQNIPETAWTIIPVRIQYRAFQMNDALV